MQTRTLRLNYEFSRVYRKGRYAAGRYVVVHYLKRSGRSKRFGITASRQIRGSVRRNRIKRLLRESCRTIENKLPEGYDYIFVGRNAREPLDYHRVIYDMIKVLGRVGLYDAGAGENGDNNA